MTARPLILGCLLLTALVPPRATAEEGSSAVDLDRERDAVLAADRAFAQAVASREAKRLLAFFLPEAIFHSQTVSRGPDAILKVWTPFFDAGHEASLDWDPKDAQVARSGEMAWTSGDATVQLKRPWGEVQTRHDRYLTLWQKNPDGAWKIRANGSLVVYPDGSEVRDLRRAVSGFWDPLAELDGAVDFSWNPETVIEAVSGEMAFTLGTYQVEVRQDEAVRRGEGGYFSVWKKIQEQNDFDPRWVIVAESFSPPASP